MGSLLVAGDQLRLGLAMSYPVASGQVVAQHFSVPLPRVFPQVDVGPCHLVEDLV